MLQAFHDCQIAWRVEADIEPKNHLRKNAHHPREVSSPNGLHHHWIDDKEIKDRVIAFDSFKRSGRSWSLENGAELFISNLFAEASFDNFIVVKFCDCFINTASFGFWELVIGISELIGVIDLNQQRIVDGLPGETLILQINFVDCLVE